MSLSKDQVSVVIPVYNDETNLHYCLSALTKEIGQQPVEVIVIDDCSSDNSAEIIQQYNVTYYKNEKNLGQSKSRNHGAKLAKSKYVLFLDSDVVVQSGCFDQIENFIAQKKDDNLIGMRGVISLKHPNPTWSNLIYTAYQYLHLHKPFYTVICNSSLLLIQENIFHQIGGFNEGISFLEDTELGIRISDNGYCLQSGPIEFIHRKNVGWKWLFQTVFCGGQKHKSLKYLSNQKNNERPVSQNKKVKNNTMIKLLFEGGLLVCFSGLLFLFSNLQVWQAIGTIFLFAFFIFIKNFHYIFSMKKNPLFFLVASSVIMSMPWIVIAGYLMYTPDTNIKQKWQASRVN